MVYLDQLPDHAYIPGLNERHPEDTFDALRQTVERGQDADTLALCDAFRAGLRFLDAGFYWEAHEVLEPVWMILPDGSIERQFVQGLIQLANGCLKLRMGRPKAALRLVAIARTLVPVDRPKEKPTAKPMTIMSVEVREVHRWIDVLESDVLLAI